jgi:hypothetical protein
MLISGEIPPTLIFFMKLLTNISDLPSQTKGFCCTYIFKKNNLNFNNLDYQTSISKLHNLDYII